MNERIFQTRQQDKKKREKGDKEIEEPFLFSSARAKISSMFIACNACASPASSVDENNCSAYSKQKKQPKNEKKRENNNKKNNKKYNKKAFVDIKHHNQIILMVVTNPKSNDLA